VSNFCTLIFGDYFLKRREFVLLFVVVIVVLLYCLIVEMLSGSCSPGAEVVVSVR